MITYVCMAIAYRKTKHQPDKVANPARGQLNRNIKISLSPSAPENLVSRDGFGRPPSRFSPLTLHTQAESDWSIWCLLTGFLPLPTKKFTHTTNRHRISPEFIRSRNYVPWRSPPRVRWHRASSPQGSSSNRCCLGRSPWTNFYAFLSSHTHCPPSINMPTSYQQ